MNFLTRIISSARIIFAADCTSLCEADMLTEVLPNISHARSFGFMSREYAVQTIRMINSLLKKSFFSLV